MEKIKKLVLPEEGRVIVISDVHGELELLEKLLRKVEFQADDYLIIIGDLCEKGRNSMGVVNYVMELAAKNPNVFVTEGNCDALIEELVQENPQLISYLGRRPHSIINEWLEELGFAVDENTDIQVIKGMLLNHYSKEMGWLAELPTAIETNDYIFVHAGLDDSRNWRMTKRETAITLKEFLKKSHQAEQYVVVGHWPTVNYSTDILSYNPYIEPTKKIISIDGGNVIKKSGQLNAWIIHRSCHGDTFSHTYVDQLEPGISVQNFRTNTDMSGAITYPNYHLVPLQENRHFTLCKQAETGKQLYIKNEYIEKNSEGIYAAKADVSCAQIDVNIGDKVSIIDDSCSGYVYIKKDGLAGWVERGVIQEDNSHV